jgi:hypothetical protein
MQSGFGSRSLRAARTGDRSPRSGNNARGRICAIDMMRNANRDIILLGWDVPVLRGPQVVHIV